MSEAIHDMTAYMQMTDDSVCYRILYNDSKEPNALKAQEILLNVKQRKLYKFVGQTHVKGGNLLQKVRPLTVYITKTKKYVLNELS